MMEIGGKDIRFVSHLPYDSTYIELLTLVNRRWPGLVIELANPETESLDVFMYENAESRVLWLEDVPDNQENAKMIYLILGDWQDGKMDVTMICDESQESFVNDVIAEFQRIS